MQILDYIRQNVLFQGLDEESLKLVAAMGMMRSYEKGQVVFRAGDEGNGFYIVAEGRIKVYQDSLSGKQQILHIFGSGAAFGEVAVFQGKSFPASAVTLESSQLLFFSRDRFIEGVKQHPEIAISMLGLLSMRLRSLVNKVEALSLKDVPSRLAAYLLRLSREQDSAHLVLAMKKGELAALLGTIQETLSRALKKFSENGLIEMQGRNISLIDISRLTMIADGDSD
jgi:CRP/FNR family transcriptional regulator